MSSPSQLDSSPVLIPPPPVDDRSTFSLPDIHPEDDKSTSSVQDIHPDDNSSTSSLQAERADDKQSPSSLLDVDTVDHEVHIPFHGDHKEDMVGAVQIEDEVGTTNITALNASTDGSGGARKAAEVQGYPSTGFTTNVTGAGSAPHQSQVTGVESEIHPDQTTVVDEAKCRLTQRGEDAENDAQEGTHGHDGAGRGDHEGSGRQSYYNWLQQSCGSLDSWIHKFSGAERQFAPGKRLECLTNLTKSRTCQNQGSHRASPLRSGVGAGLQIVGNALVLGCCGVSIVAGLGMEVGGLVRDWGEIISESGGSSKAPATQQESATSETRSSTDVVNERS